MAAATSSLSATALPATTVSAFPACLYGENMRIVLEDLAPAETTAETTPGPALLPATAPSAPTAAPAGLAAFATDPGALALLVVEPCSACTVLLSAV